MSMAGEKGELSEGTASATAWTRSRDEKGGELEGSRSRTRRSLAGRVRLQWTR